MAYLGWTVVPFVRDKLARNCPERSDTAPGRHLAGLRSRRAVRTAR
jgi:hypothetical protein